MVDFVYKDVYNIYDLLEIMSILRSEEGCPWDREQNHHTIRKDLIEETYEVIEAIDNEDSELLCEELGDLLLQVVFHSQIEKEANNFDFDRVSNDICKKLIIRHPHVFGDVSVKNSSDVLKNWDSIKKVTKKQDTYTDTLNSVPKVFPALMRGYKISQRAYRAGVDYPLDKSKKIINDSVDKLSDSTINQDEAKQEIGKMLLACCNLSRKFGIDPEECLQKETDNYIKTFEQAESLLRQKETDFKFLSINELDALWHEAEKCFKADE